MGSLPLCFHDVYFFSLLCSLNLSALYFGPNLLYVKYTTPHGCSSISISLPYPCTSSAMIMLFFCTWLKIWRDSVYLMCLYNSVVSTIVQWGMYVFLYPVSDTRHITMLWKNRKLFWHFPITYWTLEGHVSTLLVHCNS